ncbi:MAG: GldG family protein [Anaerolineae bacterium]
MMVQRLKTYAPYAAYLGLAALGGAAISFLITKKLDLVTEVLLGLGLFLVAAYILLRPGEVRQVLTGRQARYGSNTLVTSLAFLGILILVNFLAGRHHLRADWTAAKEYSLSPQTIQILKELQEPVHITGFLTPADSRRTDLEDLLVEYTYHTDKITYEFVDPDANPALARQKGITSYGVLLFERGDKRQETYALDEQDITSAILKVSRDTQKGVYFVTGHQERDPDQFTQDGYSTIKQRLEQDHYLVQTLNLATITATLPSTATVLVVAGPQGAFAPEEAQRLADFLNGGGSLLVMSDPGQPVPLADTLEAWGVRFRNDLVIDPSSSFFGDVASPLVTRFQYHEITKDLGGLTTFFPLARSLEQITPSPQGVSVAPLVSTSPTSWGETDLNNRQVRYDPDVDVKGPVYLAVAARKTEGEGRLVVFGDSDFASNGVLWAVQGAVGNADLFLNAVNWLAEEKSLLAIGPEEPERRMMILTQPSMRLILYSTAGLLPLVVLIIGGIVWWSRR